MHPKLSIITVNLNNAAGLQKTIESVVNQTFTDYEYIVIDGGSTDGSVEIIKQYADKITYWVSEPDKGIYNAMNKGIKVANGEYLQFLNSGDWLLEKNTFERVFSVFPDKEVVYGNLMLISGEYKSPKKITFTNLFFGSLPHPATFFKRSLFDNYGLYNEEFKIVSDWEFYLIVLAKNSCSFEHIDIPITYFDQNGISSQEAMLKIQIKEREIVLSNHFPLMYDDYIELQQNKQELKYYKTSKLVQAVKKFHQGKIYSYFKKIKRIF